MTVFDAGQHPIGFLLASKAEEAIAYDGGEGA